MATNLLSSIRQIYGANLVAYHVPSQIAGNGDLNALVNTATVNSSTGVWTTPAAHGLSTGDLVRLVSDNTLPANFTLAGRYRVRNVTSTTFTLHRTAADASGNTNVIVPTNTGTGTHRVFTTNTVNSWGQEGFQVFQQTPANQPRVRRCLDGTPVLEFNGNNALSGYGPEYSNAWAGASGLTAFMVTLPTDVGARRPIFVNQRSGGTKNQFSVEFAAATGALSFEGCVQAADTVATFNTNIPVKVNSWPFVSVSWDAKTALINGSMNGTTFAGQLGTGNSSGFGGALAQFCVGHNGVGNAFLGAMAVLIIVKRPSTQAELQQVETLIRQAFPVRNVLRTCGDSLQDMNADEFYMAYSETQRLPYLLQDRLSSPDKFVIDAKARGGRGIGDGFTPEAWVLAGSTELDPYLPPPLCKRIINLYDSCGNDIFKATRTNAQIVTDLNTFGQARKAAWNDVKNIFVVPSGNGGAAADERMLAIANTIKANKAAAYVDEVVDLRQYAQFANPKISDISSVDATSDVITTAQAHNLTTGDPVRVATLGTIPGGLNTGTAPNTATNYWVNVTGPNTVTLHPSQADATAGTNKVNITSTGSGTHQLWDLRPAYNADYYLMTNSPYASPTDNTHPTPAAMVIMADAQASVAVAQADLSA